MGYFIFCLFMVLYKMVKIMDIKVNDILEMKKEHPCGGKQFLVLRVGMDFRVRCIKCEREVMIPRIKIEKNIKKVLRDGEIVNV